MAKEALIWPDAHPVSVKRNKKVLRLLRAGDAGWGVTESQSAFVYPHSLRPLRKCAGLEAEGTSEDAMGISDVLDKAFPEEKLGVNRNEEWNLKDVRANNESNAKEGTGKESRAGEGHLYKDEGPTRRARSTERNDRTRRREATAEPGNGRGKSGEPRGVRGRDTRTRTSGRPKFYPYGNGNTAPPTGGVVYGGYMLSHSIYPQVLPNRPRTRQVHPETERVAAIAASKARASGAGPLRKSRRRQSQPPPCSRSSRMCGGYGGGEHVAPASARTCAVEAAGRSNNSSDTIPFDPVANFSALAGDAASCRRMRSRDVVRTSAGPANKMRQVHEDTRALPPPPVAGTDPSSRETKEEELIPQDDLPREARASAVPPRPPAPQPPAPQAEVGDPCTRTLHQDPNRGKSAPHSRRTATKPQAWTVDQRLANDPRNYKLLPRGWEQELITPAGIQGPITSPGEMLLLRDGGACHWLGDKGDFRKVSSLFDDAGVRDCLRWNPGS